MITRQGGTEKEKNMNIIKIVVILLHIFSHNGFFTFVVILPHSRASYNVATASHLKKTSKLFLKFRLIRNIFLIIRFFFFFWGGGGGGGGILKKWTR